MGRGLDSSGYRRRCTGGRMKKRVKLTFPQQLIKEPVIFTMAKQYNVISEHPSGPVTETVGEMILELDGSQEDVEKGIHWLRGKGIEVEMAEGDIME